MHVPWYVVKSWGLKWIFRNARFRALESSSLEYWRHSHVISDKISSIVICCKLQRILMVSGSWNILGVKMNDTQILMKIKIKNTRIFIYSSILIWITKLSKSTTLCKLFDKLLINWLVHVAKTWTDILQLYILQRNAAKFVKCIILRTSLNKVTYIWIQVSFRFIRTDCNDYHWLALIFFKDHK